MGWKDSLAEWSKVLAQDASPQGRGLELHSCHLVVSNDYSNKNTLNSFVRQLTQ